MRWGGGFVGLRWDTMEWCRGQARARLWNCTRMLSQFPLSPLKCPCATVDAAIACIFLGEMSNDDTHSNEVLVE